MNRNLKQVLNLGLPRDSGFRLGLVLTILQGLSAVALMATSGWLISRSAEHPPVMFLNMAVVLVRGFALGRAFFRYLERITLHDSAFRTQTDLRKAVYSKIVPLAPVGFASVNRSKTVAGLVQDVDELQNLPLRVLAPLAQALVVSLATVGFLALLQPQAALSLFIALVLVAILVVPISAKFGRSAGRDSAPARAQLAAETTGLLENLDVLQAYGWTDAATKKVLEASHRLIEVNRKQAVTAGFGNGALTFLAAAATAATSYYGAIVVLQGSQPRVMLAVFALMPIALFDLLTNVLPAVGAWQRYLSSAQRVNETLRSEPPLEIRTSEAGISLDFIDSIELKGVSARYPGESNPAITDLNLSLRTGQSTLVRGNSGSGKTTIALVLTRFLNVSAGSFQINGVDAGLYEPRSIRQRIGYLEQIPTMFMGTLRDNLLIAKPDATDQELLRILNRVGLTNSFIGRAGLDTLIGERGYAISGGEAQRIALARALLADFQVLIFDEPTASVDPDLASELWNDILSIVETDPTKAVVVITHESLASERFSNTLTL